MSRHIKETSLRPACLDEIYNTSINLNDLVTANKSLYAITAAAIISVIAIVVLVALGA
jgi:hypothetical protein